MVAREINRFSSMLYEVGVSSAAAAVATCESGTDESEDFFYILFTTQNPRSGATTNQFGDQKVLHQCDSLKKNHSSGTQRHTC